jgi:RalBP1-associated Eps domain-containing protein
VTTIRLDANPPAPLPRSNLTNTLLGQNTGIQRTSAFEVYKKPSKSRSSQSPPGSQIAEQTRTQEYEKQVLAISESLRKVRFQKHADQAAHEVLKHLKDQNILLMRLCSDLSEELQSIQRKKEEIRSLAEP